MICRKCWNEAYLRTFTNPWKSQAEHYSEILEEKAGKICIPKEQAGEYWDEEKSEGRGIIQINRTIFRIWI